MNKTRIVFFAVVLIASLVAWFASRSITRPLTELTQAATALAGGAYSPVMTSARSDEVGELSRAFQETTAFIDSSGHCLFIAFAILDLPDAFQGMIDECNGLLGTSWVTADVTRIGAEVLAMERAFNAGAGLDSAADRMPEFMKIEPVPPHNFVWDVSDAELDVVRG